ncbi:MAG: VanW family protein [Polyangiales bacterium]
MFFASKLVALILVFTIGTSIIASASPVTPAERESESASEAAEESAESAELTLPFGFSLDTQMAVYSTRFRTHGRSRARAHNVTRAAELLHQTIIAPHGTLSFNEAVGARTRANGFRRAMVIDGGELVPGMGGGVCQVASTLYAAALGAGLDVVDARPHSRPSSYIPMGLDATVSYPNLDLVLSNPFDFPIQVLAHASEGVMVVELIGQARPIETSVRRRVLSRQPFEERIVEDPAMPVGTREVTQEGIRGARIVVTRTLRDESGATREERNVVRYPPTDEIIRVGSQAPSGLARLTSWLR